MHLLQTTKPLMAEIAALTTERTGNALLHFFLLGSHTVQGAIGLGAACISMNHIHEWHLSSNSVAHVWAFLLLQDVR